MRIAFIVLSILNAVGGIVLVAIVHGIRRTLSMSWAWELILTAILIRAIHGIVSAGMVFNSCGAMTWATLAQAALGSAVMVLSCVGFALFRRDVRGLMME